MIVTPIQGRNGEPIAAHDGILLLFDRRSPQPPIGQPVEIMISHAPNRRYRPDYWEMSEADKDKPENRPTYPFLIVRPVTPDDCLVHHRGFQCIGSMCSTTATLEERSSTYVRNAVGVPFSWLTPGRTPVIVANNVNVGWGGQVTKPLTPGSAYVTAADVRAGLHRICGVPDLDQVDPEILGALARQSPRSASPPSEPRRTVDTLTSRRGQRSA